MLDRDRLICFGARLIANMGPRYLRFGNIMAVFQWDDVDDVLARDGDFLIGPVNKERIEAVSGSFILGMDRSSKLFEQRIATYDSMATADFNAVHQVIREEPVKLLSEAAARDGKIDVVNGYARLVAGRVAAVLFGIKGPSEPDLLRVARAVFHETFLNLGNDEKVRKTGIAAGQELKSWIAAERARRLSQGVLGNDMLGRLLQRERDGLTSEADVSNILAGMLVGSIDTTATVVSNIMVEVLSDPVLAEGIRRDLNDRRRLYGWCWEALRRRPHNPIVIREAIAGTTAAGVPVKAGTRIFAVTVAAMQDERKFDQPTKLNPDRPPHLYMHFGRGMHLCAGRDVNAAQIPALIAALMRYHPTGAPKVKSAGPFPDNFIVGIRSPQ